MKAVFFVLLILSAAAVCEAAAEEQSEDERCYDYLDETVEDRKAWQIVYCPTKEDIEEMAEERERQSAGQHAREEKRSTEEKRDETFFVDELGIIR